MIFNFGPWARIARLSRATGRLRAKITDLEEQLVTAKVAEARAQAQIAILRPLLDEEKKAKQNAFDRLANALGVPSVYEEQKPIATGEPVPYGNTPKDWIAEAQRMEDEAARKLQDQKVDNLMRYRREADESSAPEQQGQEALATAEQVS